MLPAYSAQIRLETDKNLDATARYGLSKLSEVLGETGHAVSETKGGEAPELTIVAGLASGNIAARALKSANTPLPRLPESLAIKRMSLQGKPVLVLCGADSRGLMYAALDVADRVRWAAKSSDPLTYVHDTAESPYIAERGISTYTMQRAYFESRLYDENYWKRYFDLLARSRINAFTVIFGYENGGFLAPPYPYFFNTPSYDGVRMTGITVEQQERNKNAFNAMIRIAHERGISIHAAIWDHIYRGGVQAGGIPGASEKAGKPVPGLVTGLTAENLAPYTKAALPRFMQVFSGLDGIEFRMHTESGLKREEMGPFWHDVFSLLKQANPDIRVTLRAKDLPDSIIDDALKQGLNIRIETKYWMEQMGMPFHPTHINPQNQHDRRHGYADLIQYPQRYRILWRLWSGGTTRLLLWSDPEYVRRYAKSARLYDGKSIDVNEMLATRMLGQPHDEPPLPILNAKYRFYDYDFERYWSFYQVWGRVSYNPATPDEVWQKEFERRFGAAGPDVMEALHLASRVLPRIVAAAYRYRLFPTTRGWAEMMRQGDLPQFASLEGTDVEQFMSPKDEARSLIDGSDTSKRRPEETSQWFSDTADGILAHVTRIDVSKAPLNSEIRSTVTDLKILAWLARYYAARLPAAVSYDLFTMTKNPAALDAAIASERKAVDAWRQVVESAGDVYSPNLAFGVHAVGFPRHWSEELTRLEQGLDVLTEQRKKLQAPANTAPKELPHRTDRADTQTPTVKLVPAGKARPGEALLVTAHAEDLSGIKSLRLRYRHVTQMEDYLTADMVRDPKTGLYSAQIPGEFITASQDVMYFVEAIDNAGNGRNYPDLETTSPYVVVSVERPVANAL
jgi:hypothetical protein